ncbi:hypothetical protein GCM10027168_63390 [Streptomyces capparidis]
MQPNNNDDLPADTLLSIGAVAPHAHDRRTRQHLVSQVLLHRFTAPGPQGNRLYPFDLDHPERRHKLKPPSSVAFIEDFVRYASASLEELWGRTESAMRDVFESIERGDTLNDPAKMVTLKDFLALHFVRSHHYADKFTDIYKTTYQQHRRQLLETGGGQMLLRLASLQEFGLDITGPDGLAARFDQLTAPTVRAYESGALFRVHIEEGFHKVRKWIEQMVPSRKY